MVGYAVAGNAGFVIDDGQRMNLLNMKREEEKMSKEDDLKTDELVAVYLRKEIEGYIAKRFSENPPECSRFHLGMPQKLQSGIVNDSVNVFRKTLKISFELPCRLK